MRKLYEEFFRICKHKKITDKVMLTRVAMTVVVIVICLISMAITAYGYFSHDITSASNTIKSANFETSVLVYINDGNTLTPITSDRKKFKLEGLEPGKTYTISIEATTLSTASTGFIVVWSEDCQEIYHTQQLGVDEVATGGKTEKITFAITVTNATDVILEARWGTSVYYDDYRENGDTNDLYITSQNDTIETINMIINGVVNPPSSNSTGDDDKSEPGENNNPQNAEPSTPLEQTPNNPQDDAPTSKEENTPTE